MVKWETVLANNATHNQLLKHNAELAQKGATGGVLSLPAYVICTAEEEQEQRERDDEAEEEEEAGAPNNVTVLN